MTRWAQRRTPWVLASVATAALGLHGCASQATSGTRVSVNPVATSPNILTYQPFTATYRAATRRHVEQEFNGQLTATQVAIDYFLSTEVTEAEDGLRATLRIDSVPMLSGLPPAEATRAAGATFKTLLTRNGNVRDFEGTNSDAELVRQLNLRLREFFPPLPPGGARPGQQWTDTVETDAGTRDLELVIRSINRHEILGWDEWGGEPGLHIVTVSDYTLSGSGFEAGQEYTLEGTGVEHAHQYVAADGRFLGLVSSDTLHSTAVLPAIGATIPIMQTRTDTLAIVR